MESDNSTGPDLKSFNAIPPKRPGQQVAGRKGGHLGQRTAMVFKQPNGDNSKQGEEKKTNADFRALINKT
jgi:hypothetical protein